MEDHIDALIKCAKEGLLGESYCIGTESDISNNDLVKNICNLMQISERLRDCDFLFHFFSTLAVAAYPSSW